MISLIAAIGRNRELGKGNTLLWKIPADMQHFKETTEGHSVIMGRKTFESIGRALPNRKNIVVTRDNNYTAKNVEVAHSLEEAISRTKGEDEVFIIGGGEIYKEAMKIADKLYITHVAAEDKDADAFFPEIIPIVWNETSHKEHKKDSQNMHDYTFSVYEKFF